jgi:hypothetical protein
LQLLQRRIAVQQKLAHSLDIAVICHDGDDADEVDDRDDLSE